MTRLALLLVLVMVGCAEVPETPPPYDIRFGPGISDYEKQQWWTAAMAWNAVVGHQVFVEAVEGRCGHVLVTLDPDERGETLDSRCGAAIKMRQEGDKAMRLHELGHVLGLEHRAGSVMSHDGSGAQELTPEDGAEVRGYWGLADPDGP